MLNNDGTITLSIEKSLFFEEDSVNYDNVLNEFGDFEIISLDSKPYSDYVSIILRRSDFSYCEDIARGLDFLSISKSEVKDYYKITTNNFLCLSECWIPYAWSLISSRNLHLTDKLIIIHVDDHKDLMPPFIGSYKGCFKDLLTNRVVSFSEPESLKNAVKSGAITIGSMLIPIVYSVKEVMILHLKQSKIDCEAYSMVKSAKGYPILGKNANLICVNFEKCSSIGRNSKLFYLQSCNIERLIPFITENSEIMLHIDMDYFNNRYNGSTDWKYSSLIHDPDLKKQKEVMKTLCEKLGYINHRYPIHYVFVGISPSFYPVEFWQEGLQYLFNELILNGINVSDLLRVTNLEVY